MHEGNKTANWRGTVANQVVESGSMRSMRAGARIAASTFPGCSSASTAWDKARSRELGGAGLGLAIVKHLVMAHAGSARVESAAGQGSTFFFEIPVRHPGDSPQPDPSQRMLF